MVTINFVWGGLKHGLKKLVHLLSVVQLFATPQTRREDESDAEVPSGLQFLFTAPTPVPPTTRHRRPSLFIFRRGPASLSFTISRSLLKLMSVE